MSEENEEPIAAVTFDGEYVKELRTENASWRHKVRELEEKLVYQDLSVEFARRGIDVDPRIINIPEGMTAKDVAEEFANVFQPVNAETTTHTSYPKGITPNRSNPSASSPPAQGAFGGRNLKEVQADPKAREQVRSMYRDLLRQGSYGSNETIYNS